MTRREIFFEAGVQYGHKTSSWCPKMKPFIWGKKDGIHLINIAITDIQLSKAEQLLESIASKGLPILWVGTKKIAKNIIKTCAQKTNSPYFCERWVGGTITNYYEVKKAVKNMLYNKEILEKSADKGYYTKKELGVFNKRIERSEKTVGGIENLSWPVGALVIADVNKDCVAVKEALREGIPVIALVDTNCNPDGVTVVIPANDDLEDSVNAIFNYLLEAVQKGIATYRAQQVASQENVDKDGGKHNNKNFSGKHHNKFHNKDNQVNNQKRAYLKDENGDHAEKSVSVSDNQAGIINEAILAEKVDVALAKKEEVVLKEADNNVSQKNDSKPVVAKKTVKADVQQKKSPKESEKASVAEKTVLNSTKSSSKKPGAKKTSSGSASSSVGRTSDKSQNAKSLKALAKNKTTLK